MNDADGDRLPLLIEYYLNTSPLSPNLLPTPFRAEGGEWVWSLPPHPLLSRAVEGTVEHSGDLENWEDATTVDGVLWHSGASGPGPRFFRLRVSWDEITLVGVHRISAKTDAR